MENRRNEQLNINDQRNKLDVISLNMSKHSSVILMEVRFAKECTSFLCDL